MRFKAKAELGSTPSHLHIYIYIYYQFEVAARAQPVFVRSRSPVARSIMIFVIYVVAWWNFAMYYPGGPLTPLPSHVNANMQGGVEPMCTYKSHVRILGSLCIRGGLPEGKILSRL